MKDTLAIPQARLARNTLLNLLGQGIPLVVAVLAIPVIVGRLGPVRFGILSLAWVVVGSFSIFDLGLGRAATKGVAEALGAGEEDRVPRIAWTAVTVQLGLGLLGAVVLAAITPLLVNRILKIPQDFLQEARSTFYILAFSVPVVLVVGSLRGILEAAQRFDLVNAVRAPFSSSNFLLPLVGVLLGRALPTIVALLVISWFVAAAVYYRLCVSVYPALNKPPNFHRAEFRRLIGFGSWVTMSNVLGPVLVYLDRFLIGTILSIAAVGYYSAPYEMITRLWVVPASLVATLFPAFSTLSAQRRTGAFQHLLPRATKYLLLVLGPTVVVIVALAQDILHLWLGPAFSQRSTVALQILAVGVLLNSLAQIPYALIQALGRPDLTAKFHLLELPIHVVVAWTLVSTLGITGAALAWTLRVAFDGVLLFGATTRLAHVPARVFLTGRVPHTAGVLIGLGGLTLILVGSLSAVWLRLSALALLLVPVVLIAWHYLLDDGDRARLSGVLGALNPTASK